MRRQRSIGPGRLERERRGEPLKRFEQVTELPMLALAAAFVPIILLPMVMELRTSWVTAIDGLSWLIWGVFAAELTVRTYLSDNRLRYLRRH